MGAPPLHVDTQAEEARKSRKREAMKAIPPPVSHDVSDHTSPSVCYQYNSIPLTHFFFLSLPPLSTGAKSTRATPLHQWSAVTTATIRPHRAMLVSVLSYHNLEYKPEYLNMTDLHPPQLSIWSYFNSNSTASSWGAYVPHLRGQ